MFKTERGGYGVDLRSNWQWQEHQIVNDDYPNGCTIDCYGIEYLDGKYILTYRWPWWAEDYDPADRYSTFQFCDWVKGLHGNPPSGTRYGYFKITLPNRKRIKINVYI